MIVGLINNYFYINLMLINLITRPLAQAVARDILIFLNKRKSSCWAALSFV
jgi:hypothetical protein